jgi:RNA polymerase sigma-70 factor (ECF subfamily)
MQQFLQNLFHLHNTDEQPESRIIQNEIDSELWDAIRSLNDRHRIPLILRYYHDLPVADIAAILDIPTGTVHSRLNHAREKLNSLLKEEQE